MKRQVWDQDPRLVLHSSSQHWKRGITPSIKPPINGAAATADSHSWGWNFRPNYLHSQISGDLQFISSSSHLEPHRGKFPPFSPFVFYCFTRFLHHEEQIWFNWVCVLVQESARGAVEIAKKFFPNVESKWGEAGLSEIIEDASIIGVAVVLAGQTQANLLPLTVCVCVCAWWKYYCFTFKLKKVVPEWKCKKLIMEYKLESGY